MRFMVIGIKAVLAALAVTVLLGCPTGSPPMRKRRRALAVGNLRRLDVLPYAMGGYTGRGTWAATGGISGMWSRAARCRLFW